MIQYDFIIVNLSPWTGEIFWNSWLISFNLLKNFVWHPLESTLIQKIHIYISYTHAFDFILVALVLQMVPWLVSNFNLPGIFGFSSVVSFQWIVPNFLSSKKRRPINWSVLVLGLQFNSNIRLCNSLAFGYWMVKDQVHQGACPSCGYGLFGFYLLLEIVKEN